MGTWIEIALKDAVQLILRSSPSWGRGLKFGAVGVLKLSQKVVPLMGTWIEIK